MALTDVHDYTKISLINTMNSYMLRAVMWQSSGLLK
jgi:hypothetical protein